jgi:hypothetical protein
VKTPNLICPGCGYENQTERGWRVHMSRSHGGYSKEDLEKAGIEQSAHDRIKFMSGFRSLEEVQAAAPATEGEGQAASGQPAARGGRIARTPRLSKEEQEKAAELAEFERLKPVLLKKWQRRLRMVYGVWARLAEDPKIKLSDDEAEEGSEMHVELMQAFGWIHAGKIEAVVDLLMWHGGMVLSRSALGEQLLAQFQGEPTPETEQVQ